ncbi:hypothetical protein Agub_g14766 [Astrephomene gubernaculifera]|uniref:Cilia-and flagella-associated protein 96 n=1 Tax=Astrephomene gubernaculifera TaxID=47775 RepID=A0AAD3HT70_9CHLO|nr:hypothetical protein Agub_g14766 [Astrephomene gubernaculifera]
MADEPLFGVFKEEKGLAVSGEPYEKPVETHTRHQGKQLIVNNLSAIKGHGRDTWLDKNLQLITPSDSYCEPLDLPTIVAARAGPGAGSEPDSGGRISDKPFRPSHPAAKSGRNAGSLYGTFGPNDIFFDPDANARRPITAPSDPPRPLGNIYTNNPKRGGPGYPDQYRLLAGGSYKYVPDEYNRGRILEKSMKTEARARIPKPFCHGTRTSGCFTPDSQLYATPPRRPPSRPRSEAPGRPAWRPNNPAARGPYCGLLSQPAYVPCPEPGDKPKSQSPSPARPFVPTSGGFKRLSMWSVNPYEREARPPADPDGMALV